jgi:DNA-binding NarL/FixJ family response regulator
MPDIALLDHNMPGLTGIEIAEKIKQEQLPVKVILLTMHNERSLLQRAEQVNVKGFLLKDSAVLEIENCIDAVSRNKTYYSNELNNKLQDSRYSSDVEELNKLSPAERKILRYIADEKTTSDIANMLFISEKTVEKHRKNIIQKLNLPHAKNSLLVWAMKHIK